MYTAKLWQLMENEVESWRTVPENTQSLLTIDYETGALWFVKWRLSRLLIRYNVAIDLKFCEGWSRLETFEQLMNLLCLFEHVWDL